MQIRDQKLPHGRRHYAAELTAKEVDEYYQQALTRLASGVKITGFRPGKAPAKLVREQLKPEALREEAYTLAVQGAWQEIIKTIQSKPTGGAKATAGEASLPIHDPEVSVGDFAENKTATIEFEFDVRPTVTVKNWEKINLNKVTRQPVGDKQVNELLESLRKAHAKTVMTLEHSKLGDKMEITFTGSVKGVAKDKLSSKHFPLILGEQSVVPGFAEELVGLKKGETKKFALKFPKDHFDPELAGQPIDFEVTVDEVYNLNLPAIDDELAKKFGHDKLEELKSAIRTDLEARHDDEYKVQQKAEWLAAFEKCVATDLPKSLIDSEIARSRAGWEDFLQKRHLNPSDWLARQKTTLEEMEKSWRQAAESSVKIGLGLSKIAEEKKKHLHGNDDYQAFLDALVLEATGKSAKASKK